jgi:O-methyltransferase involved in polyketide biosynthesis
MASCDVVKKSAHKIELDPAEEAVILIGLYLRVVDAASPKPLLGDIYAQGIINKVDCDFTRSLFTLDDNYVRYAAGRAKKMDVWCEDFLAQHGEEPVTVLNIACALDSRHLRIDRKSTVRWIDVDTPRVTSLRERKRGFELRHQVACTNQHCRSARSTISQLSPLGSQFY